MMPSSAVELLSTMIACDSVNPAISGRPMAELALVERIEAVAGETGLTTRRLSVHDRAPNLLVTGASDPGLPWLLFHSHLDTVGVGGMEVPPFTATLRDGRLHGRGACDAKGSGAAMLWALREHATAEDVRPTANVAILFAVDEEVSRAGVDTFLERQLPDLGWRLAGVVVGEPTGLRLVVAHNGIARCTIRTTGVAAHSSDPARGRSAIRAMLTVVAAIEERYIAPLAASHPLTGPAACSINVIRGGTGVNMIPDACLIELDRRTLPGEDGRDVMAGLEAILADLRAGDPDLDVAIHDPIIHAPLEPTVGAAFADGVAAVMARAGLAPDPMGVGFGTDAGAYAAAGIPAVVLGPGAIAQAHAPSEWVAIDELERAVDLYRAIMVAGPG
jgi:acetylornithine deacetylase